MWMYVACHHAQVLPEIAVSFLAGFMQGSWKWVNEAKQGSKQPKWGYTSSTVGDAVTLRVTRRKAAASLLGLGTSNSSVLVGLGVLKSYKGMGAAAVACTQGCTCSPQIFELQHKQQVGDLLDSNIPVAVKICIPKLSTAVGSCAVSAS